MQQPYGIISSRVAAPKRLMRPGVRVGAFVAEVASGATVYVASWRSRSRSSMATTRPPTGFPADHCIERCNDRFGSSHPGIVRIAARVPRPTVSRDVKPHT